MLLDSKLFSFVADTLQNKSPNTLRRMQLAISEGVPTKKGEIMRLGKYDWRVLDIQNGKMLILCEKVIGKRAYHSKYRDIRWDGDITWAKCDLRTYLNGAFYDSLGQDKARIAKTRITTNNNPWYGTKGGKTTSDRIFLLSIEEVVYYFGDSGQLKSQPEDVNYISDQYNSARIASDKSGTASWWWLRSPGYYGNVAAGVDTGGGLSLCGNIVIYDGVGVRPALWLNL